ncbi:MAG TPA: metallopeptidase TldD-related protein [Kofleriaceae bacterium]|nr:metallopeptidase TldD-related protein [Kofleriaceae bacterium]
MSHRIPAALRAPFSAEGDAPIDSHLANKLLELALEGGADYADLYFEFRVSADYVLDEERVKTVGRGITLGLGVRVVAKNATGCAYTEDLSWEKMAHAARTASQIARSGKTLPPQGFTSQQLPNYYPVEELSLMVAAPEKLALLRAADRAARAHDPRIIKVEASFAESLREILVFPSDGARATDLQPSIRLGARAVAEQAGKRQSGSGGGGGRYGLEYFADSTHEAAAHGVEAARVAVAMLDAREAPAGEMTVVLGPGDSGILLHEAVGHGLEADFNRKQTSNYSGQLGQQVASKLCTVIDDGTVAHSRGTINVDDEGHLPQRNVLIENGILVGYMHDRLSSRHFGVAPSGNGRRESFRSMPLPRMTNTALLGGQDNPEDILRSVKRGIYAKRFSGGQVNISNGDFVFALLESYLIEDGKLTTPLRGVNLIGNGPDVLRRVDMVGSDYRYSDGMWTCDKDGQSVPVNVGTPTVRIASITVGGTQV